MILGSNLVWALGVVISCQVLIINAKNSVPVFLWGGEGEKSSSKPGVNPLQKISITDFEIILNEKLGRSSPPLLVFVRDNLCVEDLKQNEEFLDNVDWAYLSAVESPMSVFENLPSYNLTKEDDPKSISENQWVKVLFSEFDVISEIYKEFHQTSPGLVAALTGNNCIFNRSERVRRAAGNTEEKNGTLFFEDLDRSVLLYASELPRVKDSGSSDFIQLSSLVNSSSEAKRDNNSVTVKLMFTSERSSTVKLEFIFKLMEGYYKLSNLMYSNFTNSTEINSLSPNQEIIFPKTFSYHCSENTTFSINGTVKVILKDFQVQCDAKNGKFDDAYDCVGYMTIPILTGIFVTGILALIMIWGITMIMDIRTMDRFDDPKGKTITISATE